MDHTDPSTAGRPEQEAYIASLLGLEDWRTLHLHNYDHMDYLRPQGSRRVLRPLASEQKAAPAGTEFEAVDFVLFAVEH